MKKKKNKNNLYKVTSFILIVLTVIAAGVIVYFNVIPSKYLFIFLCLVFIGVLFLVYKLNSKTKIRAKIISFIIGIFIMIIEVVGIFYASGTLNFFKDILDDGYVYETYGIYVLNDSNISKLKDLKDKNIVFYSNNDESKELALNKIKNKISIKIERLNNQSNAIDKVINNDYSALYINQSLMDIYLEDNPDEFKLIDTFEIKYKTESEFELVDITKKPFVLYLSGIDTTGKVQNSARSDVNLLLVVNPKSGKVLMINTPRDYYIKLDSKKEMDKLTHAGIYGVEESAKSLGLLYDVEVNYYARVNFTSFIKIINALEGIKVNVEKPDYRYNNGIDCLGYICEQNSNREFAEDKIIYVKSGVQTLNGEEALAYARNRYQYSDGDNARVRHQLEIINAVIDKALSKAIITKYNNLLKSLSSGVKTNLDQKMITKMINYQLDKNIKWNIESITVSGVDDYKPTYSTGNAKAYVMMPNEEDIINVQHAIKKTIEN